MVDGYIGFMYLDENGLLEVAMQWKNRFNRMLKRYNDIYYDAALGNCNDDEEADFFQDTMLESCEYEELFEDPDTEWYDLYRYMIYIIRTD